MAPSARAFAHFVLLEPDLRDTGGHFHDFAAAMRIAAVQSAMRSSTVGNRAAPEGLGGLDITPALDRLSQSFVPVWAGGYALDPLIAARRFARDLDRVVTPLSGPDTLVLAATANHRHYGALARWTLGMSRAASPALAVMLRFSEFDAQKGRWRRTATLTKRGLAALARAARTRRVGLFTDSERLASEYNELAPLPIRVIPAPFLVPDGLVAATMERSAPATLRFGFFGQARAEKGFGTLVASIEDIAARGELAGISLSVKCYVRAGYGGQAHGDLERLRELGLSELRLLPGMLGSDAYHREFGTCDAVLLPYAPERYRARTSGVFVDALACGMPVVTTAGSWMSGELDRHGAGLVIPADDPRALTDAIIATRRRWPDLSRRARDGAPSWRKGRRPTDFVRGVASLFD